MKFYEIISEKDFEYHFNWIMKAQDKNDCDTSIYKSYYPKKYPCLTYHDWEDRSWNNYEDYMYHIWFAHIYQDENGNWSPEIIRDWG